MWFRSKEFNLADLTWDDLKAELQTQFRPVDHLRRVRDQFAKCVQTGGVHGYITAFHKILVQVSDASAAEALDRFVRGLKPYIQRQVTIQ